MSGAIDPSNTGNSRLVHFYPYSSVTATCRPPQIQAIAEAPQTWPARSAVHLGTQWEHFQGALNEPNAQQQHNAKTPPDTATCIPQSLRVTLRLHQ